MQLVPFLRPSRPSLASRPHVVIVGGGFGGLYAAKALRGQDVRITILDRRNFHLFQPLLYQVASGWLSPSEIASPLRVVFEHDENIEVLLGEVVDIDLEGRRAYLADGDSITYDHLIVAVGAVVNHLGREEWARLAPGLKTVEDAVELRRRILLAFEAAEREPDRDEVVRWLTFVVIGGGTTGVEVAGVLGELAGEILRGNFRRIDPSQARIVLIQSRDRVIPDFGPRLAASAARDLERLGVTIRTNTRVTAIDDDGVELSAAGGSARIDARTVIWAAGIRAAPLGERLAERAGVRPASGGRVPVEPDLTLPGHRNVYVIGDVAAIPRSRRNGEEVPGLAPAAMQAGEHAASSIMRSIRGQPRRRFRYRDRGELATIGRGAAVAAIGSLRFDGFIAWLVWVFVHLAYLIEFENRFVVLTRWMWDFFRRERGSRLVTGDPLAPTFRRRVRAADVEVGSAAAARVTVAPGSSPPPARWAADRRQRRRLGRVEWVPAEGGPDGKVPAPARPAGGRERR